MTEQDFELSDEAKSYLPIDDVLRLAIIPRNWQLQRKSVAREGAKAGQVTWSAFRYYVSMESALKDIVHIKVAQQTFRTAQGLVEANTRVINDLCKALSPSYKMEAA